MRKLAALILVAGMIGPFAGEALARTVTISGRHSQAEIKSTCKAAEGSFSPNTVNPPGGYACDNVAKGTSVTCDSKGHCTGTVPRQAPGGLQTVGGLLGGSAGLPSAPRGDGQVETPADPRVPTPPPIVRDHR